jgi:hypothetical protein
MASEKASATKAAPPQLGGKTTPFAIIALFSWVAGPIGVVLNIIALRRARKANNAIGEALGILGMILSVLMTTAFILLWVVEK